MLKRLFTVAILITVSSAQATQSLRVPTPEEYVAHVGGDARIVPAGEFKLDGYTLYCGTRLTVIDNKLDDYAASYPSYVIMNLKLLAMVSTPVKLWAYARQCGHQFRGPDNAIADCFGIQRGRRRGWLNSEGLAEICNFISPAKEDATHASGPKRCELMRKCFGDLSFEPHLERSTLKKPKPQPVRPSKAEEASPWLKKKADYWLDKYCSHVKGMKNLNCRTDQKGKLSRKFKILTEAGQRWVRESCPKLDPGRFRGELLLTDCFHSQVEAMHRPGWPLIEHLPQNERDRIGQRCPRSDGPSRWRDCVEKETGALAKSAPSSNDDTTENEQEWSAQVTTATIRLPPWSSGRPVMPRRFAKRVLTAKDVFSAVSPSVYLVVAGRTVQAIKKGEGVLGSAVAVSEHYAITNCHVIEDQPLIALIDVTTKRAFEATVTHGHEATDRCFVRVKGKLTPISAVRRVQDLSIGERVYSIGNPSGLTKSLGEGLVSGLRRNDGIQLVQTTAPISSGSSGGALVDSRGALVGITSFLLKDSQNLNFAIAAEEFWKRQ